MISEPDPSPVFNTSLSLASMLSVSRATCLLWSVCGSLTDGCPYLICQTKQMDSEQLLTSLVAEICCSQCFSMRSWVVLLLTASRLTASTTYPPCFQGGRTSEAPAEIYRRASQSR